MKKVLILLVTGTWSLLLSGFAGSQLPPASKIVIASPRFSAGAAIPDAGLLHSLRSFAMTDDKSPSPAVSWLEETWRSDRLVSTSA